MDQEQAEKNMAAAVMITITRLDDAELSTLGMALILDNFPDPVHCYYEKAEKASWIMGGKVHEMTRKVLEKCVPHEILRRQEGDVKKETEDDV